MEMRSFDIELANPEREQRLRSIIDKMDLYVYEADEDTQQGRVRVSVAGDTDMMPSQLEREIRDMGLGNISVDKSETRMKEYIPTAKDPASEGMTPDLRFGKSDYDPELVNDYLRKVNSVIDQSVLSDPGEQQVSTKRSGAGRPEQKSATYNEYMRYLVNEVKNEGNVSEEEAVDVIDEVVEDLVERGKLPEPPDPEDRTEDVAEWVIAAKTFALSKYVLQVIRDVEMQGGDTSDWLSQNDASEVEGSKQFSQDDQKYKGEFGWGDDDYLESRSRSGRQLGESDYYGGQTPRAISQAWHSGKDRGEGFNFDNYRGTSSWSYIDTTNMGIDVYHDKEGDLYGVMGDIAVHLTPYLNELRSRSGRTLGEVRTTPPEDDEFTSEDFSRMIRRFERALKPKGFRLDQTNINKGRMFAKFVGDLKGKRVGIVFYENQEGLQDLKYQVRLEDDPSKRTLVSEEMAPPGGMAEEQARIIIREAKKSIEKMESRSRSGRYFSERRGGLKPVFDKMANLLEKPRSNAEGQAWERLNDAIGELYSFESKVGQASDNREMANWLGGVVRELESVKDMSRVGEVFSYLREMKAAFEENNREAVQKVKEKIIQRLNASRSRSGRTLSENSIPDKYAGVIDVSWEPLQSNLEFNSRVYSDVKKTVKQMLNRALKEHDMEILDLRIEEKELAEAKARIGFIDVDEQKSEDALKQEIKEEFFKAVGEAAKLIRDNSNEFPSEGGGFIAPFIDEPEPGQLAWSAAHAFLPIDSAPSASQPIMPKRIKRFGIKWNPGYFSQTNMFQSRSRSGRALNEATPNQLRSPEDIPKAMKGAAYGSVKEVAEKTLRDNNDDPEEAAREWVNTTFDQFDPQFDKEQAHREMVDFFMGVKEGGMVESKKKSGSQLMTEALEGFSDEVDEREAKKFFKSMAKTIERKVESARYSSMVQDVEAILEDVAGGYEMDFIVYLPGDEVQILIQPNELKGEIGKKQGAIEGPIKWQITTASGGTFGREFEGFYSTEGGLIGDATMILDEIEKHVNQSVSESKKN